MTAKTLKSTDELEIELKKIKVAVKATNEVNLSLIKQKQMLLLKLGRGPPDQQSLYDEVQELKLEDSNRKVKWCFFTLNFIEDITLPQILNVMHNIVNKCWMQKIPWYYCIEQRGISLETMGQGLHVHLLMPKPKDKQPYNCKNEIWSSYNKYCKLNQKLVFEKHLLMIPQEWKDEKIEYLKGNKTKDLDGSKAIKVKFDRIFREKNNLKDLYSK